MTSDEKNLGKPPCPVGNPFHPGTGNKYQQETDYLSPTGNLELTRHYNSRFSHTRPSPAIDHGLGMNWSMTYSRQINVLGNTIRMVRDDGYTEYFNCTASPCLGSTDSRFAISRDAMGYTLVDQDTLENYDPDGKLQTITNATGVMQTLSYDQNGRLEQVTASTGEYLVFGYDSSEPDRIKTVTDHANRQWTYRYDSTGTDYLKNNLEFVDYPDGATRQYHYNEAAYTTGASLPNTLTGITDERGVRYATFEYDGENRIRASYHAENADRVEIVYNTDGTRTITNSKGQPSIYTTPAQVGVSLITDITGPGCSTCGTGNTAFDYDPDTNDLLARTSNGITTKYGHYDTNGNPGCKVEGITAADTSIGACTFDPLASPAARRTDYTYDPRFFSKIAGITEPSIYTGARKITTYEYDEFGNRTLETITGYTPTGTPVSRTTTREYNGPLHQLTRVDGPRTDVSDITTYRYYPNDPGEGSNRARLKEIENATGTLTRSNIQYTPTGKVATERRPNELSLSYTYYPGNDRLETLTETGSSTVHVTRWTYLATGEVKTITTAAGMPDATTLTFGYDDARRLVRITDGLGNFIEYILDTEGNREAEKFYDAAGVLHKTLTQTFDIYNRLDVSSQANENVDYDFAPDGTLEQSIDGRGSVTDYGYDTLNRLATSTRDPGTLDVQTHYGYDVADRLTTITDPNGNATRYAYDDLGNLRMQTSPDTGTTSFQYDDAGNLIQQTDARGQVFTYSYDGLNRVISVDAAGTVDDIIYTYDSCMNGTGQLCSVVRDLTTVNYRYTPRGDIAGIDQTLTTWPGRQQADSTLDLAYDAAGRRKTLIYPSGAVVTYHYDAAGQVSGVDLDTGGTVTALMSNATYLPFGPLTEQRLGNGLGHTSRYDQAYRIRAFDSDAFFDMLSYDGNGNALTRYTPSGTHTHTYDALNRLDTSTGPYGSRDYDYDPNTNRTRLIDDGRSTTYSYTPNSNRLDAIGGTSVTLDPNGNSTGLGELILTYTADNRIKAVSGIANYAYNGLGQRVQKTTRDAGLARYRFIRKRVYFYGPEGNLLAELGPTGQVTREYVHANGTLLAVIDHLPDSGEPILKGDMDQDGAISIDDFREWYFRYYRNGLDPAFEVTGDGLMNRMDYHAMINCIRNGACHATSYETRIYYAHNDHLGTPHALSDATGIKVWSAVYDPFGKATVDEDPDENGTAITLNMRFPGQYYDSETGLH
ncbi:MAG: RHS domain-containing protein, partial [Gammaproteobacteria bacterium]